MPTHTALVRVTALDLDPPDESRVQNNIGGVLSALGQMEPALEAYRDSVEAEPTFADGWYNLGNLLLGMERHTEAEAHLRHALRFAPRHPKAPRKLEQLRAERTKLAQAQFETEQQLLDIEAAAELCRSDAACSQAEAEQAASRRDADGPLIV